MRCPSVPRNLALAMLIVAGQPAWAGTDCDAPPEKWQSVGAVRDLAARNGWRVERLKIDDGCYEIKGRDADGRRLKAKIDPATLEVISVKRAHEGPERRPRGGPAPRVPGSAPTGLLGPALAFELA